MPQPPKTLFGTPISPGVLRKGERMRARFARKSGYTGTTEYPLCAESNPILGPFFGVQNLVSRTGGIPLDYEKGILIGTIRMGYGHYRIAMAAASAAHALGYTPYWFDLLGFDTAGARMIRDLDKWYSLGSRISQKSKLFNKLLWDPLMGKWYKRLEKNYPVMAAAEVFSDIYRALPKDMPLLATHPFNAHGAIHAGMTRVINMIPDNCPLGFHLVDGATQTVQTPSNYFGFRSLKEMGPKGRVIPGVPAAQIEMTGHYIDHELVTNIEADCQARLRRIAEKKPRRLLISIGGAGAQQQLVADIVKHLLPLVRVGRVTLFVNFGDHEKAWNHLRHHVKGFEDVAQKHVEWADTVSFAQQAVSGEVGGLHTFLHRDTFCAVYATNLLMRASDVLLTKPSELAYYPLPKLMLERVGGHEAWGAIRAGELGDGTIECPGTPLALQALDMLIHEDDLLTLYCENILKLHQIGIYNGAYKVVELAMQGQGSGGGPLCQDD